MMKSIPLQATLWIRGEAKVEDGWVILKPKRIEPYGLIDGDAIAFDLAALSLPLQPREIVKFVLRHGLLDKHAIDKRESLEQWEAGVKSIKDLVQIAAACQKAKSDLSEDVERLRRLLINALNLHPEPAIDVPRIESIGGPALIYYGIRYLTTRLSEGIKAMTFVVAAPDQDVMPPLDEESSSLVYLAARAPDLVSLAHFSVAKMLDSERAFGECLRCGQFFPVIHGNSRFCSKRCANAERMSRYRNKRDAEV